MKLLLLSLFFVSSALARTAPNPSITPGDLCQPTDSDFKGYDYPEHIARCNRNIQLPEKEEVAKAYGDIPKSDWPNYEFDHVIPLCAGGSNSSKNLFPQPINEAHEKDKLENDICLRMKAGALSQADAIKMVNDWFASSDNTNPAETKVPTVERTSTTNVECRTTKDIRITFLAESSLSISHTVIALTEPDGDHEVLRVDGMTEGRSLNAAKGGLKHHDEFKLSPTAVDHFSLFLTTGELTSQQKTFTGYLKVSFDGERPSLKSIHCEKK